MGDAKECSPFDTPVFRISILPKRHSGVAYESTVDVCYIQIQYNKTVTIQLQYCSIILGCRTGIWLSLPPENILQHFFSIHFYFA